MHAASYLKNRQALPPSGGPLAGPRPLLRTPLADASNTYNTTEQPRATLRRPNTSATGSAASYPTGSKAFQTRSASRELGQCGLEHNRQTLFSCKDTGRAVVGGEARLGVTPAEKYVVRREVKRGQKETVRRRCCSCEANKYRKTSNGYLSLETGVEWVVDKYTWSALSFGGSEREEKESGPEKPSTPPRASRSSARPESFKGDQREPKYGNAGIPYSKRKHLRRL